VRLELDAVVDRTRHGLEDPELLELDLRLRGLPPRRRHVDRAEPREEQGNHRDEREWHAPVDVAANPQGGTPRDTKRRESYL